MNSYKKLTKNKTKKLSETAQDQFHMIHSFGKNENITNFVNMWMLEDPIQKPTTDPCGPFQLYFCENLFFFQQKQQTTQLQKTKEQCRGWVGGGSTQNDRQKKSKFHNFKILGY